MKTDGDRVLVRDLTVRSAVALAPEERAERRQIAVTAAIHCDVSRAAASDDLRDSIDYSSLKKRILSRVERSGFRTLARLAEEIARLCLEDPRVERVEVRAETAPDMRRAGRMGVEISRARDEPGRASGKRKRKDATP